MFALPVREAFVLAGESKDIIRENYQSSICSKSIELWEIMCVQAEVGKMSDHATGEKDHVLRTTEEEKGRATAMARAGVRRAKADAVR